MRLAHKIKRYAVSGIKDKMCWKKRINTFDGHKILNGRRFPCVNKATD